MLEEPLLVKFDRAKSLVNFERESRTSIEVEITDYEKQIVHITEVEKEISLGSKKVKKMKAIITI